ncbi:hypothetical protein LMH87_009306 [Akanthomyces muscarius]|uniref:Uncharacterized protein n=1 Tax=Akanthomyces muscarius TaxID=2231603 RepID=A0A9W8UM46_AKAMU|nr:hypothetical protein LMH87_009306 [Akanthomyces muscarius]KAJ4152786.1 hypothetical protein LMH87_009306 [Akanthomyces muscarius]
MCVLAHLKRRRKDGYKLMQKYKDETPPARQLRTLPRTMTMAIPVARSYITMHTNAIPTDNSFGNSAVGAGAG